MFDFIVRKMMHIIGSSSMKYDDDMMIMVDTMHMLLDDMMIMVDTMHMVVDMEMLMVKADIINIYFFHYGI
jgi:hypothetical protein